jgi:hypothetical protein
MQNQVSEDMDFFLMANLTLKLTGLPFVVWILRRGNARHDVRVKLSPGPRFISDMTTVAIIPETRVIEGQMKTQDFAPLNQWIQLNRDVLIRYWDGDIEFTEAAIAAIRSI